MSGRIGGIAKKLETGALLPDRDLALLHDVCNRIAAGEYVRVRQRKVVSPRPVRPDMRAGRREQGRLAVEYCNAMPASLSDLAKAARLIEHLHNYRSSAWENEKALAEPPRGRHAVFWAMLKAYDRLPTCTRTITRKLESSRNHTGTVQPTSVDR